jgi:hypothetical protein
MIILLRLQMGGIYGEDFTDIEKFFRDTPIASRLVFLKLDLLEGRDVL